MCASIGFEELGFHSILDVVCREIMHAMWKPAKYKYVYIACCFYVFSITIPHSLAIYWAFGDELLHKNNAFAVLPSSNARSTAIIFMIMHQVC
jgi:auxin influx carrier (AUX1 LAX family)